MAEKKYWIAAGVVVAVAAVAIFGWTRPASAPAPAGAQDEGVASSMNEVTDAPAPQAPAKEFKEFTVNPLDTIASWDFQGAYANNPTLAAKASEEIARLTALIGTGKYTDYELYISIANQYNLLGNGQAEFTYLKKALALDSTQTGLAWYNAGQLFARLGAYRTARTAFEGAVRAQPFPQYENALADFRAEHPQ